MPRVNVESDNYSSEYQQLAADLVYFRRSHRRKTQGSEIDAFPNMWTVGIAELQPGQVGIQRHNDLIQRSGRWAAFIPPFNMVHWRLAPGVLNWEAYISVADLPPFISKTAFAFPWRPEWQPKTADDLIGILKGITEPLPIEKEEEVSAIALKAKTLIDQTFSDSEMSVAEVAKKLNVSHSFMTRAFKKAYGLTPVTYRTKLRIFESTKLLLLGGFDVTSAGHQVGFTDTARFNKQFRHLMNTVPSKYCLHKLRKKENS